MTEFSGAHTVDGEEVFSYEYIQDLRDKDKKHRDPYNVIAQAGGQERGLSSDADITIYGGARGGGKSFVILLETLKDIYKQGFRSLVLRKEIDDLSDLIEVSSGIYGDFGTYNRSKNDMTWNWTNGGFLKFSYHAGAYQDFHDRFQGKQFAYIAIDEITQMDYDKFNYIITSNRNAFGIRNRVIGTCNPDKYSWVKQFIQWWINDDPNSEQFGLPIPERDGKVRYCFRDGDDPSQIVWGDSREEVYLQCKDIIDKLYTKEFHQFGKPEDLFVKSVTFIGAKLADNLQLMRSDPAYLANLANQSEEQRARDLGACWEYDSVGDDIIKQEDMNRFYHNAHHTGDNIRRVSCDVAFEGGDSLVMWLWIGHHIQDIFVCKVDSKTTVQIVKAKLLEWHVREENFTYDLNGIGQIFKGFFNKAVPFNNKEAVDPKYKYIYANLKSQAAYVFADKLKNGELSINQELLGRRFSGKGFENATLEHILDKERRCIKQTLDNENGFTLIKKSDMKKLIGHSPDFIESAVMRMVFDIKRTEKPKPKHLLRHVKPLFLR